MGFLKRREKTVKAGAQVTIDKKVLEQALLTPVKFGKKPVLAEAARGEYAYPEGEIERILGTPGARPTQITGEVSSDKLDVLSSPAPGVDVKVEFASVFRLATENRAMILFDKVVEGLCEAQFNEEQVENFKINEVIFEPVLDGKGKPVKEGDKIIYKLKEGYEWIANFLTPEQIKLGDIKFEALIETVKAKASLTKESIENFERALYGQVKGGGKNVEQEKKLEAFLTDVLDEKEIAENFGAGLQEYNPYVNIPVPVLAMHAVMSTGVLELLNSDGKPNKSEANIEQKIAALISGIPNESLRKLVEQVIGYKVVGNTIKPLTMEEDKFKDLRGSMLTKMVKRAKAEKVRDGSIVEPAILAQAKNLHDLHGELVARGFIPQGPDFEDKKRARINVLKEEFMLSLSPEQRKTYVSVFAAQDAEARMQYINAYMKNRRREAVTTYGKVVGLDETKTKDLLVRFGVEEPTAESAGKKGRKQEVQMPFFGELNGIVSSNIVLLSEMQQAVISSAGTYRDGVPAENIAKYRKQEEILLGFNGAVLDMIEARDAAAIAHDVANTVKLDKIEETIDNPDVKSAENAVFEAEQKVKEAKVVLQAQEASALTARIEYVFAGLELYINATLARMSLPLTAMDSRKEEYRKRLLACIKTPKGKEPYIDEKALEREYVECFSNFAQAVAKKKKEAFNSETAAAEAKAKFQSSKTKLVELEAMDYDKLVEHERGLLPEGLYDQLESTDPTVSANAQTTLTSHLPTMNVVARQEYMLVNALRRVKEAERGLHREEELLHDAKSKLQTLHYNTYHIGLGKAKLEEVVLKLPALEELLVTLETSKAKIAELNFDELIEGLDLSKEQKARLKENVKTLKENKSEFIKQLDSMIESLKEQIAQMKSDLSKQYDIVEVLVPGSDRKRLVLLDNPRKIIELQEKGYTVDGKGAVSFTEGDYAIHPTAIKIAKLRHTIDHGSEKEKKAAQAELDTIVASIPTDKPSRDKILSDVVRIERYERTQTPGKNPQYKEPLTTADVVEDMVVLEVDVETNHIEEKGVVVSTKSIEQLGEQLGVEISKEEKIQNIKDRVLAVSEKYNTLDISSVDADKLRTFIADCKGALEGADNVEYAAELNAFAPVGTLRGRLTAAEHRLDELEAAREAKEVVIEKINAIAIPEKIAEITDLAALTTFVSDAEKLCQDLNNNPEWRAVLAAEELPEYKALTEALAAAKERKAELELSATHVKEQKIIEIKNKVNEATDKYNTFNIAEADIDTLKTFVEDCENALVDADNAEYATELAGFVPITTLRARLEIAKSRIIELSADKTPKEVVVDKINTIAIPEKIAEITDLTVLTTFVSDAEKLCQELNNNPEWRAVLAAEELPEYKALTEALAAAKERVTELSADASVTPPVYEEENMVETFVINTNRLNIIRQFELTHEKLGKRILNPAAPVTADLPSKEDIVKELTDCVSELLELKGLNLTDAEKDALAIGDVPERVADVISEIDLNSRIELFKIKDKLPKEDAARTAFIEDAVAFSVEDETFADDTEKAAAEDRLRTRFGHDLDGIETLKDPTLADMAKPAKEKSPKYTEKACDDAIKAAGKRIKKLKESIAETSAKIKAQAIKQKQDSLLRAGYAKYLAEKLGYTAGMDFSGLTTLEEDGADAGELAVDEKIVLKFLSGLGKAHYDEASGKLYTITASGNKYFIEDEIYSMAANDAGTNRRQKVLHKHLHTVATREVMQKGADLIGQVLTENGCEINERNIDLLLSNNLKIVKEGVETVVEIPRELNELVAEQQRTINDSMGRTM